jgi:hypothetical protein
VYIWPTAAERSRAPESFALKTGSDKTRMCTAAAFMPTPMLRIVCGQAAGSAALQQRPASLPRAPPSYSASSSVDDGTALAAAAAVGVLTAPLAGAADSSGTGTATTIAARWRWSMGGGHGRSPSSAATAAAAAAAERAAAATAAGAAGSTTATMMLPASLSTGVLTGLSSGNIARRSRSRSEHEASALAAAAAAAAAAGYSAVGSSSTHNCSSSMVLADADGPVMRGIVACDFNGNVKVFVKQGSAPA